MWLATPVAIMVASWAWASKWILIKSWETLEKSQKIDEVVFDKTGTLTAWKPTVTDCIDFHEDETELQQIAKALSVNSHHPLSQAVVNFTETVQEIDLSNFEEKSGHGLLATIETKSGKEKVVWTGNEKLVVHLGWSVDDEIRSQVEQMQEAWKTVNYVIKWMKIIGLIGLLDTPKPDARETIQWLQKLGVEVIMISWDTKKTVAAIADQIWIDRFYAEVLPDEKANHVKDLQSEGKFVAFVWDGINDAPALAQSDLGIWIGHGSDIAVETADIVLVNGEPHKVLEWILLARKTYSIIKQNLFWAFAYNTILVPVAAFGLLLPIYASLAMSLSSVSVVLNSLRIRR